MNGERARTYWSASSENPCLFASINNVTFPGARFSPTYLSANGVSAFAFTPSSRPEQFICAPYASFSVMLADRVGGLDWYRNMAVPLASPWGTLESISKDGLNNW